MCVILICEKKKPSREILEKCEIANPDGGGLAWRESGMILWKKGLTADEIADIIQRIPLPFVIHFRLATVGGKIPALCHPFPVSFSSSTFLTGKAKKVLFHNGHYLGWKEDMKNTIFKKNQKLPFGPWSDSRALAYLTASWGEGYLDLLEEKICVFSPSKIKLWGIWEQENEITYSNLFWEAPLERSYFYKKMKRC